jgi:hypothetical protein
MPNKIEDIIHEGIRVDVIRHPARLIVKTLYDHDNREATSSFIFSEVYKDETLSGFALHQRNLDFDSALRCLENLGLIEFNRGTYRFTEIGKITSRSQYN